MKALVGRRDELEVVSGNRRQGNLLPFEQERRAFEVEEHRRPALHRGLERQALERLELRELIGKHRAAGGDELPPLPRRHLIRIEARAQRLEQVIERRPRVSGETPPRPRTRRARP